MGLVRWQRRRGRPSNTPSRREESLGRAAHRKAVAATTAKTPRATGKDGEDSPKPPPLPQLHYRSLLRRCCVVSFPLQAFDSLRFPCQSFLRSPATPSLFISASWVNFVQILPR
ncbi:unnamed protein product [Linum trigynum]|uniref:Uncharacterized protein n=1 Tax=Linum trigynum TaxID=586398 RepID=A0AAV2CSD3_9ROSI